MPETSTSLAQASLAASGSGAGWADFLLGDVQSWQANNSPLFGGRQKSPQVFIQDDIKLRPNLTVNLGLRYQIQRGWKEVQDRMGDFDPTIFNTVSGNDGAMWFAPANHRSQAQANVYSGVLPRVGFAILSSHNGYSRRMGNVHHPVECRSVWERKGHRIWTVRKRAGSDQWRHAAYHIFRSRSLLRH